MASITQIERQFLAQKNRLLKNLESVEKRKRARFSRIAGELERYKKKEATLKGMESKASSHLRQLNQTAERMKKQEQEDRKRARELMNEIAGLKREIPRIKKDMKKVGPARRTAAKQDVAVSRRLSSASARVREIERRRDSFQRELDAIAKKEAMLRQGRIYWTAASNAAKQVQSTQRHARPRKAARPQAKAVSKQKATFLDNLFGKK